MLSIGFIPDEFISHLRIYYRQKNKYIQIQTRIINQIQIDAGEAYALAQRLNPEMMGIKQRVLEAESALDRAKKESRFNADLDISYGLNQSAGTVNAAYTDPQMVSLSINIPLLDRGDSKGQRQMAYSQKQVTEIEVKQAMLDFEQEVNLKVIDFNLQGQLVLSAAKADSLATHSYELTKQRFVLGKVDVLRLTNAMKNSQQAKEAYINSLAAYWRYLYEVQEIALYDFVNGFSIEEDFELLINR